MTLTVLRVAAGLLLAVAAAPALGLLAVAETAEGRAVALAVLAGAAAGLAALARRKRPAAAAGAVAGMLMMFVLARAPDGTPLPGSGFESRFLEPARFHQLSLANLIPESDQIALSSTDLALRFFGTSLPMCLRHTREMYRAMHADPAYRALGSVLHDGWAHYLSIAAGRPHELPGAHWYQYTPKVPAGKRVPVLIFLQGFGGNYKSYLYVWRQFADRAGVAVIVPSLGFGAVQTREPRWDRMWEEWAKDPRLDLAHAWIAGLSNGSVLAARLAGERPGAYRGVILISPIAAGLNALGMPVYRADRPLDTAPYPPSLVIYGAHDGYGHEPIFKLHSDRLAASGIPFERRCYQDMDHYLIYRVPDRYHADLIEWMAATERLPSR